MKKVIFNQKNENYVNVENVDFHKYYLYLINNIPCGFVCSKNYVNYYDKNTEEFWLIHIFDSNIGPGSFTRLNNCYDSHEKMTLATYLNYVKNVQTCYQKDFLEFDDFYEMIQYVLDHKS